MAQLTKFVTKEHRLSYVHVSAPSKMGKDDKKPKYNHTVLMDKKHPDVKKLNAILREIYEEEKNGVFKGKRFEKLVNPIKDGDEYFLDHPDNPEYQGCVFFKVTSDKPYPCYDNQKPAERILDLDDPEDGVYSGCFGRTSFAIKPFEWENTNYGFSFYANSLQKTDDGERLGASGGSAADFEDDEDDDDLT